MAISTEIPLVPSQAQRFTIKLNDISYNLRLTYNVSSTPSWILDIGDSAGDVMVAGIPLVSGVDLLSQYTYLGFEGALVLTTDRGAGEIPGFDDLGVTAHLFFVVS